MRASRAASKWAGALPRRLLLAALRRVCPRFVGTHAAAAIEQEDDALVALVLVLADHRAAGAPGRLPVDVANGIARPVIRELLEIGAAAALAGTT